MRPDMQQDKRVQEPNKGGLFRSVTKLIFVATLVFALIWVSISYGIAVYSTIALEQPFPVVELSQQAITTILGVAVLKVLENIFEHNEGPLFGRSNKDETEGVG